MKKTVDNELEHLLRTSADEMRLRPSAKVWKGINARLQRRKRNYRAAVLLLLLIGLTVGVYITTSTTGSNNNNNNNIINIAGAQKTPDGNKAPNGLPATTGNNKPVTANTSAAANPQKNTQAVAVSYSPVENAAQPAPLPNGNNKNGNTSPNETATVPNNTNNNNVSASGEIPVMPITETLAVAITNNISSVTEPAENNKEESASQQSSSSFTKIQNGQEEHTNGVNNTEKLTAENKNNTKTGARKENKINSKENLPVKDITDAAIQVTQKQRRVTTEFYLVPSISYRKLVDSRDPNAAGAISKEDFDKAVYHKPSLGLEAGVSWHYRVYDRFRAKAGLQLNYNRFNMKATRAPQTETARIVLYGNNQVENPSSLRTDNENGLVQWIKNKNLQISIPVGFEVAVTAPSKANTTLNIGTTIQPSYLLGNKNYLLSTDLKNYTTEPSLVRRFNMNLGFETFFAFETKKLRWHMGPQLRYQLFSTYNKEYPYKENLIDYTFKISVSKPF